MIAIKLTHISSRKLKILFFVFCSLLFAFLLTLLPNEYFRDRANYIIYAKDSLNIMERYDGIALITNEPLFLLLNNMLSFIFDAEMVPLFFVYFIGFSVSYFIFIRSRNILLTVLGFMALVLVPQSFHMLLVVLRQAFTATVLMWLIYYFWQSKYFLLLVFLLGFIHSSAFIVFAFLAIDKLFSLLISKNILHRVCFVILISSVVSFFIMPLAEVLALRQATQYQDEVNGGGGGNFILYMSVLLVTLSQRKKIHTEDGFYVVALVGISVYVGMYFFSPFAGRLVTSFLPLIICLMCMFGNVRAFFLLAGFVLVNSLIFKNSIESNSLSEQGVRYLLGGY
ncbi:EpsG family protein [Shewanella mangrovisoli]|uniref:EpsG family protein n=1 Tax=Shewanella mangrovisoli TaxID=2864211 RepID=UPI0035B93350